MKACVVSAAKDLKLVDIPEPIARTGEVVVALGAGGICGSDLHYYQEGGVADFRIREPLVLGHEVAGTVVRVGPEVTRVKEGDRVAVNPNHPCGTCRQCQAGRRHLCTQVRFFGSAARFPHIQGAFAERFVSAEGNCFILPDSVSYRAAACAEPLAVALHAAGQCGSLLGKSVFIAGSGPIGVLLVAAARLGGASTICVTDLVDEPLRIAKTMGATDAICVAREPDALAELATRIGGFEVCFEASGHPSGLASALQSCAPAGTIVQVGMLPRGPSPVALSALVARELRLVGSFRFGPEYSTAISAIADGRVDVTPMLTHEFGFDDLIGAFTVALDKRVSMKVSLRPQ